MATLTHLVAQHGYLGIFVLVFVEGFGVPAPGESAIILGGGYAAHGELNIIGVAVVAFLAAVTGDSLGYLIGRTGGRALVLRYGRFVRLTHVRLARFEAFMGRHGPKVVAIARFVEGLRQFNGIVAGATGMPWRRFVVFNALGAAAWVGVWSAAGYLAGEHVRAIEVGLHRYQWYAIPVVVLLVSGYVVFRVRRRRARPVDPR